MKKDTLDIFKKIYSSRSYFNIMVANIISRFGDSIDSIAYGWMVYVLTGSKLLMGSLYAVNAIPSIVVSPFAGVLIDRMSKKKVMVIGNLGRGLVVLTTALLFFLGKLRPWHLFLFTIMNSTFEAFVNPANISVTPYVLSEELYISAMSFSASLATFAELIGLGVTGVIIGFLGTSGAIAIDGITFVTAAIIVFFTKINEKKDINIAKEDKTNYFLSLREGIHFFMKNSVILLIVLMAAFINFGLSPVNVLLPVYANEILKTGPSGMSIMSASLSVGMIIGGFILTLIGKNVKRTGKIVTASMFTLGAGYFLLGISSKLSDSILLPIITGALSFFVIGASISFATGPLRAFMLKKTPREMLGRTSSIMSMFCLSATPLGGMMTGIVSEKISIANLFTLMSILIMLVAIMPMLNREYRAS